MSAEATPAPDVRRLVDDVVAVTGVVPPSLLAEDSPTLIAQAERDEEGIADAHIDGEPTYLIGLIGGKDVGKTSLVNAIAGQELSRPIGFGRGTDRAIAYCHESARASVEALLEREVPGRYEIVTHSVGRLVRQVLLDLPDIDSRYTDHVETTRRLLRHMLFPVWVQSVEKYADIRPRELLVRVAEGNDPANFLFVLNKVDQLAAREGDDAVRELRDDYAVRLQKALKLQTPPVVFAACATDSEAYDLPRLLLLLSRQKSGEQVRQSQVLAGKRQDQTMLAWFDAANLPEHAARAARVMESAAALVQERVTSPLITTAIPAMFDDPAVRGSIVEGAINARARRWPIVRIIDALLGPFVAAARRNLSSSTVVVSGTNTAAVDAFLPAAGGTLAQRIQSAFLQLTQSQPLARQLYDRSHAWEDDRAAALAADLRQRVNESVAAIRAEAGDTAARSGPVGALVRWLLTIGAIVWFPFLQPLLEIALPKLLNGEWLTLTPELAVWAVRVFGATYMLTSVGFLAIWFVALWAWLRFDTQRRAAGLLRRAAVDQSRPSPTAPAGIVLDWADELLDPIRAHRAKLDRLEAQIKRLRAARAV
jgi:hypothetical protein